MRYNGIQLSLLFVGLLFSRSVYSDDLYSKLFPMHADVCVGSELSKNNGAFWGPGHVTIYLKGACRDQTAPFPQIKLCDKDEVVNSDGGVLLSVNDMFQNANWVANDGITYGVYGYSKQDKLLNSVVNSERLNALTNEIINSGSYKGVIIHDRYVRSAKTEPIERYLVRNAIGTDFGMSMGRTVYCSKIPLNKSVLEKLITRFNYFNQKYYFGNLNNDLRNTFQWYVLTNNCAHLVHNGLAAIGVWKAKKINSFGIGGDLAVPTNEFVDFTSVVHESDLGDLVKVYNNPIQRKIFLEDGWLPWIAGGHVEIFNFQLPNALYHSISSMFALEIPGRFIESTNFKTYTSRPEFLNIEDSLNTSLQKYLWASKKLPPLSFFQRQRKLKSAKFVEFYNRYARFLREQVQLAEDKIQEVRTGTPY